jgi:hypothetical protein
MLTKNSIGCASSNAYMLVLPLLVVWHIFKIVVAIGLDVIWLLLVTSHWVIGSYCVWHTGWMSLRFKKEGPHCVLYPITTYLPALETHHRHHSYKFIPYSLNCKRKSIHQLNYHHHHHHVSTCKLLPISSSKRRRSWNCL